MKDFSNKRKAVCDLLAKGLTHRAIAKKVGVSVGYVSSVRSSSQCASKYPRKHPEQVVSEIAGDHWTISLPKTRIHTEEQLIEHFKIDLEKWRIEKLQCNAWEMGYKDSDSEAQVLPLYQVKAFLVRDNTVSFA